MDRRRVQRRRGRGADRRKGTRSRGRHRRASSGSGRRHPWQSCVSAGAARGDRDARRVARLRRGHDGRPCSRRDAGGARNRPRPHDAREVRRRGLAFGAFGGRAELMSRSIPRARTRSSTAAPASTLTACSDPSVARSSTLEGLTGRPRQARGRRGRTKVARACKTRRPAPTAESPKAAPLRENPHESTLLTFMVRRGSPVRVRKRASHSKYSLKCAGSLRGQARSRRPARRGGSSRRGSTRGTSARRNGNRASARPARTAGPG